MATAAGLLAQFSGGRDGGQNLNFDQSIISCGDPDINVH